MFFALSDLLVIFALQGHRTFHIAEIETNYKITKVLILKRIKEFFFMISEDNYPPEKTSLTPLTYLLRPRTCSKERTYLCLTGLKSSRVP